MKRLVASALFLVMYLPAQAWDRIDFFCVIRDAQGRSVTNLTKDRVQILSAGEPRAILEFSHPTDQPWIETIASGPNIYADTYRAIARTFAGSDRRKILVIEAQRASALTEVRRWELIFLAERRGVIIYVVSGATGSTLAPLAEETGGRVVASASEIQADLAAQYHIVAQAPPHAPKAGAYQTLEIRIGAGGLHAQAPRSFYITPPWGPDT